IYFNFFSDRVFGPATTTRHVYDVAAQHVVSGAMEGINGIFYSNSNELWCHNFMNLLCLIILQVLFLPMVLLVAERPIPCMVTKNHLVSSRWPLRMYLALFKRSHLYFHLRHLDENFFSVFHTLKYTMR
ncbi:hypothetical protein B296_00012494, partial [Ensete ventricosum]